ncbi:MAG: cation-transporting P-type ATPase [Myxococcota bacterium]|nr:cation-transporting P-type ATPase [Myxococcota bacterium]
MLVLPLGSLSAEPARVVRHRRAARLLRLEVPGLVARPDLAHRLERELPRRHPGVEELHADPRSGRVRVRYARDGRFLSELRRLEEPAAEPAQRRARRRAPREPVAWHALAVDEVLLRLGTARPGLDAGEAIRRQRRFGPNLVEDGSHRSRLDTLLDQVRNFPTVLLLGSSGISTLTRDFLDAGAILGTVGLDALMGYRIERRNEKLIASWRRLEVGSARVLRDGRMQRIEAADLVPGDVIICRAGETVPADARVIDAHRLACDESFLTGESEPRGKSVAAVAEGAPLAERDSVLFSGARVVSGRGRAVVTDTGHDTEAARIRRLVEAEEPPETPLEKHLDDLGRTVSVAGAISGGAALAAGVLRGRSPAESLRTAVALAVAAIPEGLPLVATTGLVQSMRRMREEGMAVRRLVSAETLGGVTVVCADKTGTLTLNRMRLEAVDVGGGALGAEELAAQPEKLFEDPVTLALAAAVLSSDVDVEKAGDGRFIAGSSTESAIVEAAYRAGLHRGELRKAYPRRSLRERDGGVHYVVSLHDSPGGEALAFVKGAPEQVVEMCSRDLSGRLGAAGRRRLLERNEALAARGLRVLALAWRPLDREGDAPSGDYTLIGLIGLRDPLRPDAAQTVAAARHAGIRTLVLTGDQRRTAEATARAIGLSGEVTDGATLARLLDEDSEAAGALLRRAAAVARVDPAQKAAIVRGLRAMGEVVAMAGDGVNDAPALRAADVGIAIGAGATDVSRQSADIVLAGEELAAVLAAVGEGRILQDNLRRAVRYLLATNLSEAVLAVGATALGARDPFTPMRLLWLNLISDSVPAMALALEPGRGDELARPPAPPDAPLLSADARSRLLRDGVAMAGLGALGLALGGPATSFATVTGAQIGYAFTCRSGETRPDPQFLGLVGGTAALHLVASVLPPFRSAMALPPALSLLESGGFFGGFAASLALRGVAREARIVRCGSDAANGEDPS